MVLPERHEVRSRKMSFRHIVSVDGQDRTEMALYTGMSKRGLSDRSCAPISWTGRNRRKNEMKNRQSKIKTLEKIQKSSKLCTGQKIW